MNDIWLTMSFQFSTNFWYIWRQQLNKGIQGGNTVPPGSGLGFLSAREKRPLAIHIPGSSSPRQSRFKKAAGQDIADVFLDFKVRRAAVDSCRIVGDAGRMVDKGEERYRASIGHATVNLFDATYSERKIGSEGRSEN